MDLTDTRYLEIKEEDYGDYAEFEKMPDGTLYICITGQSDAPFQSVALTVEQLAALKRWLVEN